MNKRQRDVKTKLWSRNPKWHRCIFLPLRLKKNGKATAFGILIRNSTEKTMKPIIMLANVCESPEVIKHADMVAYSSFEKLFNDGWIVD